MSIKQRPETPVTELIASARALCQKLHVVQEHPLYQSVWSVAYCHGMDYKNGPNYCEELLKLEKELEKFPE